MSPQAESIPAPGPEPGDIREIPWPTIFFWMVCLSLNSISQQTGKVLGTSCHHPSILRSSPVVCAFDAFNILASWVIHVVFPTTPPANIRLAATRVLLLRVVDDQGNPDLQAIKSFKAQTRVRWAGFALGVLPISVKLFASRRVPWSQAFGAMYLASWLLFEILVLAAMVDDNTMESIGALSQSKEEPIRKIWAIAAMILHMIIYGLPLETQRDFVSHTTDYLSYFDIFISFSMFSFRLWWSCFINPDHSPKDFQFLNLLLGTVYHFSSSLRLMVSERSLYQGLIVGVCIAGATVLSYFGQRLANWVVIILQVLNVLTQPLLLYSLVYDPTGTYQAKWFEWLG